MTKKSRGGKKFAKVNQYWRRLWKWLGVLVLGAFIQLAGAGLAAENNTVHATSRDDGCPQLEVIFARGSGSPHEQDRNYLTFREALDTKLRTTPLDYRITDLDYPAVGVGLDQLSTTIGAYVGGGLAYEFGASVNLGRSKLMETMNNGSCPDTKYVLAGYSQGAIVMSYTYKSLPSDKLIYVATFGDPKLYLPEGKGIFPAACRGQNLSDYRRYVPNCQVHEGLLKGIKPYATEQYKGRVGTWCNKDDFFCTPFMNMKSHTSYVETGLYEDAARVIFDKVGQYFGLDSKVSSPHDTVFLIDSTFSMNRLIDDYKAEALRLARETLAGGGRVALYDYRDLEDPYEPQEHCNFETCDLELFEEELEKIQTGGGGDRAESTLSAAFHAMKKLTWKFGSTKSLVILTDAEFLSPDRDGTNFNDVVALSKRIDPVNFYVITKPGVGDVYQELATATDGKVATTLGETTLTVDEILDRYDSLPMVEEEEPTDLPTLAIEDVATQTMPEPGVRVRFNTNGTRTLVILNDAILGVTYDTEITVTNLQSGIKNRLVLVPMNDAAKGEGVEAILTDGEEYWMADSSLLTGANLWGPSGMGGGESQETPGQGALLETADGQLIKLGAPNTGVPLS